MKNYAKTGLILLALFLVSGCSLTAVKNQDQAAENQNQETEASPEQAGIANPASANCIEKGGTLEMKQRADLGEYGVCFFEDNRQCEEWALFRGECPEGGVKITGYLTDAAVYCAITGGEYSITSGSEAAEEKGICKFPGGQTCDADAYYRGTCSKNNAETGDGLIANAVYNCRGDKTVDASYYSGYVELKLSDGRELKLPRAISASGARYANEDESIVFWNKADTAFIQEGDRTTFEDCAESKN